MAEDPQRPGSRAASPEPPTEVGRLLASYAAVLQATERLRTVEWLTIRSREESWAGSLRWPRFTLGTRWLVRYHVIRAVDALLREHAARAALGELDESGVRDRQALTDFKDSLRPVHWGRVITGFAVATLLFGRPLAELVLTEAPQVAFNLVRESDLTRQEVAEFFDSASLSSPASIPQALLTSAPEALLVVVLGIVMSAYFVQRPFVQAFRTKRVLLNLGVSSVGACRASPTAWHVGRSTGVYAAERRLFDRTPPPREVPMDLILGLVATLLVGGTLVSLYVADPASTTSERVLLVGVVASFGLVRLLWLVGTARARYGDEAGPGTAGPWYLPAADAVVGRRVAGTAGWMMAGLYTLILPFAWMLVWYRVLRQLDRLLAEQRASRQPVGEHRRWRTVGLAGAGVLWPAGLQLYAQLRTGRPAAVDAWRWWAVLVAGVAVHLLGWTLLLSSLALPTGLGTGVLYSSVGVYVLGLAVSAAAVQWTVNEHAEHLGTLLERVPERPAPRPRARWVLRRRLTATPAASSGAAAAH